MKYFLSSYHCLLFFLALGLSIAVKGLPTSLNSTSSLPHIKQEVWITIFVHGIISIKPYITITNCLRFLNDNVLHSPYGATVGILRNDPFFYQNQAIQSPGLIPINIETIAPGAAASAMASVYDSISQLNSASTINYYYTYGWSGLLSRSARCNDALKFLLSLEQLITEYRAQGIEPKIRILGYSHGGTLTLKLALVRCLNKIEVSFNIDEIYLIGTPIQFDTDYLIADPLFKKVYNIFSRSDRVQKMDFFSCGQFFSEHIFKPHCNFKELPSKLTQIEIRLIRKAGEKCTDFMRDDPPLLYNGKHAHRKIRNVSPGHIELWFFGWTLNNYRSTLPLYPLPIAAFLPCIINAIKPLEPQLIPEKPVIVSIDAYRNSMTIKEHRCYSPVHQLPFIESQTLKKLKEKALQYKPLPCLFNTELFAEHLEKASQEAIIHLRKNRHQDSNKALAVVYP